MEKGRPETNFLRPGISFGKPETKIRKEEIKMGKVGDWFGKVSRRKERRLHFSSVIPRRHDEESNRSSARRTDVTKRSSQ